MTDKRKINLKKQLEKLRSTTDYNIIWAKYREYDWKCTMCGFELSMARRPGYCPNCNCLDGDVKPGTRLFIRKEAHWDAQKK